MFAFTGDLIESTKCPLVSGSSILEVSGNSASASEFFFFLNVLLLFFLVYLLFGCATVRCRPVLVYCTVSDARMRDYVIIFLMRSVLRISLDVFYLEALPETYLWSDSCEQPFSI